MAGTTIPCYVPIEMVEKIRQHAARRGLPVSKLFLLGVMKLLEDDGQAVAETEYNDYEAWTRAVRVKKGTRCDRCSKVVEGVMIRPLDPDAPLTLSNSLCACIPCFSQDI